jgi:hypothetical protein
LATLLLPRCCAVTTREVFGPGSAGNGRELLIEPSLATVTVPTGRAVGPPVPSSRSTFAPASKPEPLTATVEPGRTRPGLSVMSGWPPPRIGTPSRFTVGGGGLATLTLGVLLGFDRPGRWMPSAGSTERTTLTATNSATAATARRFQFRPARRRAGAGSSDCRVLMIGPSALRRRHLSRH